MGSHILKVENIFLMITLKHYANEAIDIQSINDKLLSQLIEQKPTNI